jgi:O-antigen ligase
VQQDCLEGSPARTSVALVEGAILAGLYALPLLALFVSPRLYLPYVTPRGFAFRAIVELIFAGWVWLALADARFRPRPSGLLAGFAAVLTAMAVADALGVDPERSVFGNFVRMEGYATLLHLFAFFLVAGTVLAAERRWERYFAVSVGASAVVAAAGIAQRLGLIAAPWGAGRIDSSFGNPAYLAAYLLVQAFVGAFLLARARRAWARAMLGAAIALDLAALWLTATRGAAVGLAAGVLVAAATILLRERERRAWRRAALGAIVVVVAGGAGLAALVPGQPLGSDTMLARIARIGPDDPTIGIRLRVWTIAAAAVRDHPILGWGQENFSAAVDRHFDPVLSHGSEWVDRAHDLVLDWLVAGGAVGGLAYFSLYAAALFALWSQRRAPDGAATERAILTGLLAGYIVAELFLFDDLMTYLSFTAVLAYLQAGSTEGRAARPSRLVRPALRRALVAAAAGAAVAALWFDARGVLAAAALQQAIEAQDAPETVTANQGAGGVVLRQPAQTHAAFIAKRDGFQRAIGYHTFGTEDAREALALAAYDMLASGDDPWIRANFAPLAVAEMKRQVAAYPDARGLLFLGSVLVLLARYDEGIAALAAAAAIAPRRQSIDLALGLAYQRQGEGAKWRAATEHAFALDPSWDPARIAYASAAIATGEGALGRRLLVQRFGTDLVPDDHVIAAYDAAKNHDKVVALWRLRVARDPDNADYRLGLAGALMRAGKGIDAVKVLGTINRALTRRGSEAGPP